MNELNQKNKKRKLIKFLVRLLTLGLIVGGVFLLGYYVFSLLGGKTKLRDDIQKWTKENLAFGCFLYLILSPIVNLIPGISSIFFITLANRMLNDKTPLGRFYSFLLCDSSVRLTTVLLFFVGRTIGKKAVGWLIGEEDYRKARSILNVGGKAALPFVYLFPFFPDDTRSFVCGRSDISFRYNFVTALIFRSAGVLCCCILGTDFFDYKSFTWWRWLLAGVAFLIRLGRILLAIRFYYIHLKRKQYGIKYDLIRGLKVEDTGKISDIDTRQEKK